MSASDASSNQTPALVTAITCVLLGCGMNNIALELLIKEDLIPYAYKSSGSLLTVLQYAFIVVMTLGYGIEWSPHTFIRCKPRTIPLKHYALMAAVAGLASWLNNISFAYNISQPTHMVFRSSGLVVSFIVGYTVFAKPYTKRQGLAVSVVTIGAVLTTYAEMTQGDTAKKSTGGGGGSDTTTWTSTASSPVSCENCAANMSWETLVDRANNVWNSIWGIFDDNSTEESKYFLVWCVGMLILTSVIFLHTMLGHIQNTVYNIYGKNPQENLLYTHLIPLFGYLILFRHELPQTISVWNSSPSIDSVIDSQDMPWITGTVVRIMCFDNVIPVLKKIPVMWWFAFWNVVTQYICLSGVFRLFSHADALTGTLVMTIRKCMSLLLSVKLFGNTFTSLHWIGALLVFAAAVDYSVDSRSSNSSVSKKKTE